MKQLVSLAATLVAISVNPAGAEVTTDGDMVSAIPAPATATGLAAPDAAAGLYFSSDRNANGLFMLDPTTGAATNIGISGVNNATVGLSPAPTDDILYGSKPFAFLEINADGSGFAEVGSTGIEGLAYDGTNVYGSINGSFFLVDPTTGGNAGDLAAPGGDVEGLAFCARDGYIYGLADGGDLSYYDIGTDLWTLVGNTGVDFDQIGLACDPAGNLYAKGDQNSMLYKINRANAATTVIGDTGIADGGGLAFVGGDVDECDKNGDGEFNFQDVLAYFRSCDCGIPEVIAFYKSCR